MTSYFRRHWLAFAILIIGAFLSVTSGWNDSLIVDEIPHIGAGYSYVSQQDMRLNIEHPPLAKDFAGFPLLFVNIPHSIFSSAFWQTDTNAQWEFGRALIFNTFHNADTIRRLAHLPMLFFYLTAGWILYLWVTSLRDKRAGLIALCFYVFSPTILAHSHFVTTDVPALWGAMLAITFFFRWLALPSRKTFAYALLALGLALLCKFSLILLLPFFVVVSLLYEVAFQNQKRILNTFILILSSILLVVWPVYLFHVRHYPIERQHADTLVITGYYSPGTLSNAIIWMSDKPFIRALGHYGLGFLMTLQRTQGGNITYFFGKVTTSSFSSYFPLVYLMKEPIPWLILLGTTMIFGLYSILSIKRKQLHESAIFDWLRMHFFIFCMAIWVFLYITASITSNLNIGIRHLLPIYPPLIALVTLIIISFYDRTNSEKLRYVSRAIFLGLVTWTILEVVWAFPLYLPYFNELVGGSSGGYRYVVDSNLDWGQDLIRFSDWIKKEKISKITFDYFGWSDPAYYLGDAYIWSSSTRFVDAEDFKKRNQSDGWLAVSATFLQNASGEGQTATPNYLWLKAFQPITVIGHSIFIYRIK